MSLRIVLVGPPGAGKGTQAKLISEKWGVPTLSTGEILRANVQAGSELGKQADALISHGEFVPDELISQLVREHLSEQAKDGFILDGFPRSLAQVEALDGMLREWGTPLAAVVLIAVPDQDLIDRLLHRAELEGRLDDTREIIARRMEIYHRSTEPIIAAYQERGLLQTVDGRGTVAEVAERIAAVLPGGLPAEH